MKYLEAVEKLQKLKIGVSSSAVLKLLGEPSTRKGDDWVYNFDKLEKWPMVPGAEGEGNESFWTFRERGYVDHVKTGRFPWVPKSKLRHLLGITISFQKGKISSINCEIGVTLGRQ